MKLGKMRYKTMSYRVALFSTLDDGEFPYLIENEDHEEMIEDREDFVGWLADRLYYRIPIAENPLDILNDLSKGESIG